MKKQFILDNMQQTPMMRSIHNGTEPQLLAFRQQLNEQIAKRKAATLRSYLFLEAVTLLFFCTMISIFPTDALRLTALVISQVACAIAWWIIYWPKYRKAKIMETVLLTLVDDALQAKAREAEHLTPLERS